ncbi:MAG: T9SS type A sorting domain-containing protein [Candidatus Kapabacteria bacterium]|nr:T9SS type A sorting domain-containing protein [Ignavibacteriota bacterium]MCW5885102.1 T9SS type A sorting domain-containing protein [Candidatus Kapabacteria bacterium]
MRIITKLSVMIAFAVMTTIGAFAQNWDFTETFENHNAPTNTYSPGSFVGDNGITWNYVRGRDDQGFKINADNKSFMFAAYDANNPRITSSTISGGIKNFQVKMLKAFTGSGNRQIELYINGNYIATSIAWDNTNVQVFEVNDIDIPGDFTIEIRNLGRQVVIDDLSWTSFGGGNGGIPSKLRVTSVKPNVPMRNVPFRTLVELIDNINLNQTIPHPTRVDFKILDASANLLHEQTFYIPANSAVYFVENLTLDYSGNIQIIAEAPENKNPAGYYLDDATSPFTVSPAPVLDIDIYDKGHAGAVHPTINVYARNNDGSVNEYYHGFSSTLTINNGAYSGTVNTTFNNGIATYSDIMFTSPNTMYSVSATGQYLNPSVFKDVNVLAAPSMSEVIVPAYFKGEGSFLPDGNGRIPSYAFVTFNNLHPNTEYRFTTGGVNTIPNTNPTTAGNNLAYDHNTDSYVMTSTKNLTDVGNYSSFVTGSQETSKSVWVNLIATTNAVFAVNRDIIWTVDLGNERGSMIQRLYSSTASRSLRYSTASNNFETGLVSFASGLYDPQSPSSPKNYIVIYDENENPVTTAIVQGSGAELRTPGFPHQAHPYYENTEFTDGAWATFIPNNLPGGVRRIAEYTPQGMKVNEWTDNDGNWAGYNTIGSNYGAFPPSENSSEIAFAVPQFELITPNTGSEICNPLEPVSVIWNSRGVGLINIYISQNGQAWEPLAFDYDARQGEYIWDIIRDRYSNTDNRLRITSEEFPYIEYTTGIFRVFDTPIIGNYSQSNVWCPDEDIYLTVEATGTDLNYQWYKDGIMLHDGDDYSGVNSPIIYINNLKHRLSGAYTVRVGGHPSCESVETGPMVVYVARPLSIFKPEDDVNIGVILGETATLEFTVHGNGGNGLQDDLEKYQFKIQWYKYDPNLPVDVPLNDGMPRMAGSKSNYLTINKFTKRDEGQYYAVVKGLCGESVKTPMFKVTELELSITQQPANKEACIGSNTTFTFDYFTNINETAQINWFKNGVLISDNAKYAGTRTKTLTINNVDADDAGAYTARVTLVESGSEITSAAALMRVLNPVVILLQSEGVIEFEAGKQMLIEVIAEGNDDEVLTYQWYLNDLMIEGADEGTYIKDDITVDDAGIYTCQITGICGTVISEPVEVVITTGGSTSVNNIAELGYMLGTPVPNPVSDNFTISVETPESAYTEITISDMSGRTLATVHQGLLSEGQHQISVDVNSLRLSSGTYFIGIRTAKGSLSQSFMVIK